MSVDVSQASIPVPVTIIGGYLGAGKTTLVNHLLRHADGIRFAVLVNDFGDLPIDADLIESQDDNVISIAGGCVCCSFGSDLISALFELRDMEPRPEHLLVEASGVALPGSIAESVSLVADFKLDSVVVLADAETVHERSQQTYSADTISRQLSCTDLILLNKSDLPTTKDLEATEIWIKSEFPNAACLRTQGADVPLSLLTGRGAPPRHGGERPVWRNGEFSHHPRYGSAVFEFPAGVDPTAIAKQLAHADSNLLRSKGYLESSDGAIFVVQTVGRRFEVRQADYEIENAGRVVVITAQEREALRQLAEKIGCRFQSA